MGDIYIAKCVAQDLIFPTCLNELEEFLKILDYLFKWLYHNETLIKDLLLYITKKEKIKGLHSLVYEEGSNSSSDQGYRYKNSNDDSVDEFFNYTHTYHSPSVLFTLPKKRHGAVTSSDESDN